MIGAPGYGEDIVDSINTCDTRYLKGKICMIGTLESDDCSKSMMAHSMVCNAYYSFAEECKRLCDRSDRDNGAKGYNKYKKREGEKLKKIFYYVKIRMM